MSFSPCLLIPLYNHGQALDETVRRLLGFNLPIFIVDDGSDEATQKRLRSLSDDFPQLHLSRLERNEGKGAAVMYGLREAWRAGFSHALQIDADGQHDTGDVPRFLALGAAHPKDLICGRPLYDRSAPKGRRYGRYLTHFWVCVETLNLRLVDALCGYRLYPLASTCALIERVAIARRMDFDVEILVRLSWEGVALRNVDTRVVYPEGGLSHFDMLRDNLRISRTHARLTSGMLCRLPQRLWRRLSSAASGNHWSTRAERGSLTGLKIMLACYRLFGARVARIGLYPVIAYFFLSGRGARAASLDYLLRVHRRLGRPKPGWRDVFRHMMAFGQCGLDKLAAWLGQWDEPIDIRNPDEFERIATSPRGALLIGAHLGNLDMVRALAIRAGRKPINAIVYTDHALRFNDILQRASADFGVNLIQVTHLGPEMAILLKEKIDRGELLIIVGDRTPAGKSRSARIERVEFLGDPAPFAQGPFILGSLLDCPVYLLFCLRDKHYQAYLEPFAERLELPRRERHERLSGYVRRYAQRLEHYCLQAPEQWFNFYDFWQTEAFGKR